MDDLRIGRIARILRQRLGARQSDLAASADGSQSEYSLLERGRVDGMSVRQLRRLFKELDAQVIITVRWRGGALDQLIDARHAALGEAITQVLGELGWVVIPEVTTRCTGSAARSTSWPGTWRVGHCSLSSSSRS